MVCPTKKSHLNSISQSARSKASFQGTKEKHRSVPASAVEKNLSIHLIKRQNCSARRLAKISGGTKTDRAETPKERLQSLAFVAVRGSMTTLGDAVNIAVASATRRCVMTDREMAYNLALCFLDKAYKERKITRQTYNFLLQKLNEKYNPLVPKTSRI